MRINSKKTCKVSIICSAYNREKYLEKCVNSILSQTLADIELILIDNGSSDSTPKIVDRFAKKDSRVIAIHNQSGTTYGQALNQGIALAKGDYIGIVESDDFIHETMYEKLYEKITDFNADVCFAGFWVHIGTNDDADNPHNKLIFSNINDNSLFKIDDYPLLLTAHQSIWAKLYKANFLKKIKFDEKGKYIDSKFIIDVLCNTKKIIGLKEPVYYYRFDNPEASNSNNKRDASLISIIDDWKIAREALKSYGYYDMLKNEFYAQVSKATYRFFNNIAPQYKMSFFNKWCDFISELRKDSYYKFKYLDNARIRFFKAGFYRNYKVLNYDDYEVISFMNIPIREKIVNNGICKIKYLGGILKIKKNSTFEKKYILGFPYYKRKLDIFRCFGFKLINRPQDYRLYFLGFSLIQKKDKHYKQYIKLLYIPVFYRNNYNKALFCELSKLQNIKEELDKKIEILQKRVNYGARMVYSSISNMQALAIHKDTFGPYRNCFENKEVVVVGCGPSVAYYTPMNNVVHIGINRAFKKQDIKFDFLFAQDSFPEGMKEINDYPCTKFYGYLPNERTKEVTGIVERIAPENYINSGAKKYIIEDLVKGHWATDLAMEPIGDFQGTVFSALQFVCFGNPKAIYLVGFDCSSSVNKNLQAKAASSAYQLDAWKRFKTFIKKVHPNTKVFSVNPVGLKGEFCDVYTKPYLNNHLSINRNFVKIID